MRIQHNIMAMNSYRNFSNNTSALSKNLEKLSSGYKINRAGDDAAGLAISEKMRAQISGLAQAQKNAKSGINLVQTAEGSLTEVHDMLNRMVTLAEQSANGTYDDTVDRNNLQKEFDQLRSEIDRIADSSNFNGINLLDGSLSSGSTTALGDSVPFKLSDAQFAGLKTYQSSAKVSTITAKAAGGAVAADDVIKLTLNYADAEGKAKEVTISLTATAADKLKASDGTIYDITAGGATNAELGNAFRAELGKNEDLKALFDFGGTDESITLTSKTKGSNSASVAAVTQMTKTTNNAATVAVTGGADKSYGIQTGDGTAGTVAAFDGTGNANDFVFEVGGKKFAFVTDGNQDKLDADVNYVIAAAAAPSTTADTGEVAQMIDLIGQKTGITGITQDTGVIKFSAATKTSGGGLTLQIGDTSDDFNQLTVSVGDMHASALGIGSISIANQAGAKAAVQTIKDAINQVSSTRGDLGALQNRLDHTINNLSVMQENIQDAEATIRDTDVAEEMMAYTKNNILVQSAQAMLAQANQVPQGVLQLLQ